MKKQRQPIPFSFVVEELSALNPIVKPMFGCYAIYVGDKITLILRKKENSVEDNGLWIATVHEHHHSLKQIFPALRAIDVSARKVHGRCCPKKVMILKKRRSNSARLF